ncbi:hypothetical protein [Denitratisoma sp. DHT3]|uniref:hypothetical protein n=1 Tax=Denitratisoma sp. DHT3 TaxID=1981880 RepID=UPI00119FD37C|nr:hypothetical protein [Denitratisoma sp. DHT3]
MNSLSTELERLYLIPGQMVYPATHGPDDTPRDEAPVPFSGERLQRSLSQGQHLTIDLVTPARTTRTLVISLERGRDWPLIAGLCERLQSELDLPAPALAVSGLAGYQLWLSLATPVPLAQAHQFVQALVRRYLPEAAQVQCHPSSADDRACRVDLVPAYREATRRWSAFIDPGLGGMFADEPGLDIQPNPAGQADILAGCRSIDARAFQHALARLESPPTCATETPPTAAQPHAEPQYAPAGAYANPEAFLMAVMNDPQCPIAHRIEAARALLPYRKGAPQ